MLSRARTAQTLQIQLWPIDRLVFYIRNPRRNDAAVDRMCASICEFGFKIPCLVRSDGEVVDGELRLKAARKLGLAEGARPGTRRQLTAAEAARFAFKTFLAGDDGWDPTKVH